MVDDLLLVAIDIRHHDSHHKIVLDGTLFEINVGKIQTVAGCHLPTRRKSLPCGRRESICRLSFC